MLKLMVASSPVYSENGTGTQVDQIKCFRLWFSNRKKCLPERWDRQPHNAIPALSITIVTERVPFPPARPPVVLPFVAIPGTDTRTAPGIDPGTVPSAGSPQPTSPPSPSETFAAASIWSMHASSRPDRAKDATRIFVRVSNAADSLVVTCARHKAAQATACGGDPPGPPPPPTFADSLGRKADTSASNRLARLAILSRMEVDFATR